MSERGPALALFEFQSISTGIVAGDAMVKAAPLGSIYAGSIHPGKYLVLVTGDTASVEVALAVGREIGSGSLTDVVFLPDAHPSVGAAIRGDSRAPSIGDESLGVVETSTVAAILDAGDAGVKASGATLASIRLGDGLGGKGYALFSGPVAEVEAAIEAATSRAQAHGTLVRADVIAQLHEEMAENLRRDLRFLDRMSSSPARG